MARKSQRPVGPLVDPLPPGSKPDMRPLHGRWVVLEPVTAEAHARDLFDSFKLKLFNNTGSALRTPYMRLSGTETNKR